MRIIPRICPWCGDSTVPVLLCTGARDSSTAQTFSCRKCHFCFTEEPQGAHREDARKRCLDGQCARGDLDAACPDDVKIRHSEKQAMSCFDQLYRGSRHLTQPGSVLEIGCGAGSFLALMATAGWTARGFEPDPGYSGVGQALYGVPIDQSLLEDALVADEDFDLVASFHDLERVADPRGFLRRVHRALTSGGTFFLQVPSLDYPASGLRQFLSTRHVNVFWRAFLEHALPLEGFVLESSGFSHGNYWGLFRKSASPIPQTKAFPRPPILGACALALPSQMAITYGVGRVWRGLYLAANGQLTRDDLKRVQRRGAQILRSKMMNLRAGVSGKKPVMHVGLHCSHNAGDIMLIDATREVLVDALRRPLLGRNVHARMTDKAVDGINRATAAVIVGGGGLFLADTNPNTISGWQWPVSAKQLRRVQVPMSVFAVGYNRFRGQDRLSAQFEDSLCALAEKCVFVGIRNRGSIRELRQYLPPALQGKLLFQPCPTTVLSKLPKAGGKDLAARPAGKPVLALNAAFDRYGRRFGKRMPGVIAAIVNMMRAAHADGWEIVVARHTVEDRTIVPFLALGGVPHVVRDLCFENSAAILSFYRSVDLAVGMRGHAQMIPFGLGVPIISLITHDKLGWFLDDIGHPQWGVDASSADFADAALAAYRAAAADLDGRREAIAIARATLWQTTQSNLALLAAAHGAAG